MAGLDGCGKSRPPPGFDPRTVQPVASRYTNWAIPAHNVTSDALENSSPGRPCYRFLSFLPRRWKQYFPPKTIIRIHGVVTWIFSAVLSLECRGWIWCREDDWFLLFIAAVRESCRLHVPFVDRRGFQWRCLCEVSVPKVRSRAEHCQHHVWLGCWQLNATTGKQPDR
jgi:hypothetical protein